jgi:hypothetical protein
MRVVILDCQKDNDDTEQYTVRGWEVAKHHYDVVNDVDIVCHLWTALSLDWLYQHHVKTIVCRDFDEPDNILPMSSLKIPVKLVDGWGDDARKAYHLKHILSTGEKNVALVGPNPTWPGVVQALAEQSVTATVFNTTKEFEDADISQIKLFDFHLGKKEFPRYWLDNLFVSMPLGSTIISTTRGALYSANGLEDAYDSGHIQHAILDWLWQERQLRGNDWITNTKHTSYRSPITRQQLTRRTIEVIEEAISELSTTEQTAHV